MNIFEVFIAYLMINDNVIDNNVYKNFVNKFVIKCFFFKLSNHLVNICNDVTTIIFNACTNSGLNKKCTIACVFSAILEHEVSRTLY